MINHRKTMLIYIQITIDCNNFQKIEICQGTVYVRVLYTFLQHKKISKINASCNIKSLIQKKTPFQVAVSFCTVYDSFSWGDRSQFTGCTLRCIKFVFRYALHKPSKRLRNAYKLFQDNTGDFQIPITQMFHNI